MSDMTDDEAHDIAWFADRIKMSLEWVRHNMNVIPHRKYGRRVRFTESDVATFLARNAVDPERISRTDRSRRR